MQDVPSGPIAAPTESNLPQPAGIGGWLILPIIGLVVTLIFVAANIFEYIRNWEAIRAIFSAANDQFRPMRLPILTSGAVLAGVIATASLSLWRIFTYSSRVRATIAAFCVLACIYQLVGVWLDSATVDAFGPDQHDPSVYRDFGRALVMSAIWIAYFYRSRRVRNTFVR
jgi:hypothetical protein